MGDGALRHHLPVLDERIDARVGTIGDAHPWWPCRRGCDACCRSLGEVPHATRSEWERVAEGLRGLPTEVRAAVEARIEALRDGVQPVVCPFLDRDDGACLVYAHRLLACRTYGYYVSRGEGRWCGRIEVELATRGDAVLFGNLDAVMDEARAAGGEPITLIAWWRSRQG